MNIKKYLQQRAEEDAESLLTEEDRQFCRQLAEQVQPQPVKPKRKTFNLKTVTSLAAVLVMAVVLGVTLPLVLTKNTVDEVHYKEENVVQIACTVEDINLNAQCFQINEYENMAFRPQLNYDSVSGDKLYYTVGVSTETIEFNLYIVINENYNFVFRLGDNLITNQLSYYNINYDIKKGIDSANYTGYIKVNTETVYINYTQLFDVGEQVFFDDIQSVLKVKN